MKTPRPHHFEPVRPTPDDERESLIPKHLVAAASATPAIVYLRRPAVLAITGVAASTWHRWVAVGLAPKSRRLGPNSVGWLASEIRDWCESRAVAGGRRHG